MNPLCVYILCINTSPPPPPLPHHYSRARGEGGGCIQGLRRGSAPALCDASSVGVRWNLEADIVPAYIMCSKSCGLHFVNLLSIHHLACCCYFQTLFFISSFNLYCVLCYFLECCFSDQDFLFLASWLFVLCYGVIRQLPFLFLHALKDLVLCVYEQRN